MIELQVHKKLGDKGGDFLLRAKLSIAANSLVTLYGPSGSGKTSLLRCMAGLLTPDQGKIMFKDTLWFSSEKKVNLPPQKRNIGYVFQDNALFPNMTVLENMRFARKKTSSPELLNELVRVMDLKELTDRYPDSLSGGQKQRVSLARALAQEPDILLLDEPLAAIDAAMRIRLQEYILEAHKRFGLTTVMVSHDLAEIMRISDTTVVLEKGRASRTGPPDEVFTEKRLSGKFQFTGTVLKLQRQDVIFIVSVLIGNNIVKVVAHPSEIERIELGDKVVVASKAFNPVIYRIERD